MELLKDYDMRILYHPSKDNVVVDALIRLSTESSAHVEEEKKEFSKEVYRLAHLGVRLMNSTKGEIVVTYRVKSSLMSEV